MGEAEELCSPDPVSPANRCLDLCVRREVIQNNRAEAISLNQPVLGFLHSALNHLNWIYYPVVWDVLQQSANSVLVLGCAEREVSNWYPMHQKGSLRIPYGSSCFALESLLYLTFCTYVI